MLLVEPDQKPAKDWNDYAQSPFALAIRINLLQKAIAPWPRRAAPLLDVNCGDGTFLPMLWHAGFEVEATETDIAMRQKAQLRIRDLRVYSATDDELPFEEEYFDWVILHLTSQSSLDNCIPEALRVARRGLILTFWNSISIPALLWKICHRKKGWHSPSWWQVWRRAAKMCSRLRCMGAFWTPVKFWKRKSPLGRLNHLPCWAPLGAWCIIRMDLGPLQPITPLPLRLRNSQPQPAFEYIQLSTKNGK